MNKKKHLFLVKSGYVPVHTHVDENIVQKLNSENSSKTDVERMDDFLSALRAYEEASCRFHEPGGDGYYIVEKCLQKYLDYKFIRRNNHFRFDDSEEREQLKKSMVATSRDDYKYIPIKKKKEPMIGTQADIYYLLFEAEQESIASRRCRDYVKSNKLHLTAVLTRLIEQVVESMRKDEREKIRQYGELLRVSYLQVEYAEIEAIELYEILGCTKKQYYTRRNHAISMVSEALFGILAGENGMAELYINPEEIIIPSSEI